MFKIGLLLKQKQLNLLNPHTNKQTEAGEIQPHQPNKANLSSKNRTKNRIKKQKQ